MADSMPIDLVTQTLANLQELERRLCHERAEIDRQLVELGKNISALRKQAGSSEIGAQSGTRRKRGQNLEDVRSVFKSTPGRGYAVADLVSRTGIKPSSLQNVLRKNDEFSQSDNGLWHWKEAKRESEESKEE